MKKFISIILILTVAFLSAFSLKVFAAELSTINVTLDKTTVNPNGNITIAIDFGQDLGAYTFEIAYDHDLVEYVSTSEGTASDTGDKVIVTYYDTTGGTNPSGGLDVTFRAKTGITTSNPTNFSVTATGLANPDGSETFDDITVGIVKNFVVEPSYENYNIALNYEGNVIVDEEKAMSIVITSSMGRPYDHARILVEATKPSGTATAQLFGTDEADLEHDLIQSGWGDPSGYAIGGQNMRKQLDVRGLFSEVGTYGITVKIIDRDNSDTIISQNLFNVTVGNLEEQTNQQTTEEQTVVTKEELPTTLPKTGNNAYIAVSIVSLITLIAIIFVTKKYKEL